MLVGTVEQLEASRKNVRTLLVVAAAAVVVVPYINIGLSYIVRSQKLIIIFYSSS